MGKDKKKRKPSAYNKHVGREMKAGKTMKQAAASWDKKRSKPKSKSGGKSKSSSKSSSKTGGRKLGNTFNINKIFGLLRKAALLAPAAGVVLDPSLSGEEKVRIGFQKYTGVDMRTGEFHWNSLRQGYEPYVMTIVATTVAQKIGSFIRGILK